MAADAQRPHVTNKVNVSMVSLKWADVLSTLLPGSVAVFALAPYFPTLNQWINNIGETGIGLGVGVALLGVSALSGGVLEAFTRVTWEKYWLLRKSSPSLDVLRALKDSEHSLALYDLFAQGSYKYSTFYANFAWSMSVLLVSRLQHTDQPICSIGTLLHAGVVVILLLASHVQWGYYVKSQNIIFEVHQDVEKHAASGNKSEVSKINSESRER